MKINKNLKYATFSYDEEEKDFVIEEEDGNKVILNKVYAFAFMRFVIRIAQRNWLRTKKIVDTDPAPMVELDDDAISDLQESLQFVDYEELQPIPTEQGLTKLMKVSSEDIVYAGEWQEFYYKQPPWSADPESPAIIPDRVVEEGEAVGIDIATKDGVELVLFSNIYWSPRYEEE